MNGEVFSLFKSSSQNSSWECPPRARSYLLIHKRAYGPSATCSTSKKTTTVSTCFPQPPVYTNTQTLTIYSLLRAPIVNNSNNTTMFPTVTHVFFALALALALLTTTVQAGGDICPGFNYAVWHTAPEPVHNNQRQYGVVGHDCGKYPNSFSETCPPGNPCTCSTFTCSADPVTISGFFMEDPNDSQRNLWYACREDVRMGSCDFFNGKEGYAIEKCVNFTPFLFLLLFCWALVPLLWVGVQAESVADFTSAGMMVARTRRKASSTTSSSQSSMPRTPCWIATSKSTSWL